MSKIPNIPSHGCCALGQTIGKKAVFERVNAKTILAFSEAFSHKLLCTGPILNLGDACVFSCTYCYVAAMLHKLLYELYEECGLTHADIVIRRKDAVKKLDADLGGRGKAKLDPSAKHVVFSSSTVDPMPTKQLMLETAAACRIILEKTNWDIRILTKSTFLPQFVKHIPSQFHDRLVLGVSTGTLDDKIAKVIERGTPLVSKRIESLHWLQDNGFRTFGMICPSLPQTDYDRFSKEICKAIRVNKCEHVWAEPMNVRGASLTNTVQALQEAKLPLQASLLQKVCGTGKKDAWDDYAKALFMAHTKNIPAKKLRFLHYPTSDSFGWWKTQVRHGAVLLGANAS